MENIQILYIENSWKMWRIIGIHHRSGTWHRIAYEHTTCLVFCKIWSEINFTERCFEDPISEKLCLWKWLEVAPTNTTHIQIMHHRKYSSHVFMNPEFSIFSCFCEKEIVFKLKNNSYFAFYNLSYFLNENPFKYTDQSKRQIGGKI